MNNELVNKLVHALVHSLISILSFIFLTPLKLWLKAADRLAAQKEAGALDMANITSDWPLVSYIKRFSLDFSFDAAAFLLYPIGVFAAFGVMFTGGGFEGFIGALIGFYFSPVFCYIFHDLTVLTLLPIRKFIDWAKKPAQHMDLDIKNK
jgi:hypothetical protein